MSEEKKDVVICYVILHYQVEFDTIECVNSILAKDANLNKKIIIVDNCSPNGSGKTLEETYKYNESIKVILSASNLGFANGNNIGCEYAINFYAPDFLIALNNDTELLTNDFSDRIIEFYYENPFDVMGPRIISKIDNGDQNPVQYSIDSLAKCFKAYLKGIFLLVMNIFRLDTYYLNKYKSKEYDIIVIDDIQKDVKLHGSFLIFSKQYYQKFEHVFDNGTFMYMEEDILNARRLLNNLIFYYNPNIIVHHKEDSATNSVFNKELLKRRFVYFQSIKSLKVLTKIFLKGKAS